ncbi:MAG: fasciclin domain-containing protein [Bacteroidetes bacterium]|nr:MAG: fasciclin domain-containing protein [Bacteroidota bacterium]
MKKLLFSLTTASVLLMTACTKSTNKQQNIVDFVTGNPNFTLLTQALTKAELVSTVQNGRGITVFAPDNDAFARAGISAATITALDKVALANILAYHVVPAEVVSGQIASGSSMAATLAGTNRLNLSNFGSGIFVNGNTRVKDPNYAFTNGTVHVVDNVIMPPAGNIVAIASANPNLSLLVQAVVRCNLAGVLNGAGPFTVYAPTNDAFIRAGFTSAAITNATPATISTLTNVLLFHVLPQRAFTTDLPGTTMPVTSFGGRTLNVVNGIALRGPGNLNARSAVTIPNIAATNGVVHVIDQVLLP